MITMFNYNRSDVELFNDIVDGVNESVRMRLEGIKDHKAYDEMQSLINSNMVKYIVSGTRYEAKFEAEGTNLVKNANVTKNKDVRENFDAVITEIINSAIPVTTSAKFGDEFMEVKQVGWGDTARFLVSSNDLFQVNEIAEGVLRGVLQPIFNNEVTVNASPIQIATGVDWYQVAAGVYDWGNFGMRAGASFNGYIMLKAIAALASAISGQSSAYTQAGVATNAWATVSNRVSAANGGAGVYALGTTVALNQAVPSTVGLQYGLGNEVAKEGFLSRYLGVALLPIDQFIVPGTVNSTATLGIADDKIYFVAANSYKPVKVLYEGNSVVVENDPMTTSDKFYGISVTYRVGVAGILGSKIGVIDL